MLKKAILVAILAIIGWFVFHTAVKLGFFKHSFKHHPGKCRTINGKIFGSEDFQVTSDGLAFITSGINLPAAGQKTREFNPTGRILLFNFSAPNSGVVDLKIGKSDNFNPKTFRPHGMSLLEDKTKGEHLLYVVSHPPEQPDRIEKFRYDPKTKQLQHEKAILSDLFRTTNDLALIKEDVFYVTNFMYYQSYVAGHLEVLFGFAWCGILFYNGTGATSVVPNLSGPNGLLLSKDGRFLYVNLPHSSQMAVYSRNPEDNSLTLTQTIDLHTAADNSHFSESGDALFSGCHPAAYKMVEHFNDPGKGICHSQVLRVPLQDGLVVEKDITELFYDHGEIISASSIAAVYKDKLLIGSVINTLALCDLDNPLK